MANEFKHKDPGTELTQAEYIAACGDGHIFACQATGDIVYASSATVLSKLAKGAANTVLAMGGSCIPAWTASPSVTDLTIGGGCITLSAATDVDLIDNNACALSFDASGQAGILAIDTQNCAEGVKMSGKLTVTGAISTTGAVTVGACDTGLDVKFFGASAGAFMLYDQSCDQLEIRGASADAATSTGKLLLTTALTNINACDVIGSINFQAPLEAGGTDAVAIAAGIRAVAQATFTCAVNATDLIFYTGHSEAAAERFRFTSQNEIGIAGANYGTDGQVLTSGGAGAAVAWECAGGGLDSCADAIINNGYGIALGTSQLAAADNPACVVAEFQMAGTADADTSVHLIRHSADASPSSIKFAKSRHATIGSHTVVADNDIVGSLCFHGDDGGDLVPKLARIYAAVDGTPGTNDMPGELVFQTTADGAQAPTSAMVISSSQRVFFADGSHATPSISNIGDENTGFYFPAADAIGVVTGGSPVIRLAGRELRLYKDDCNDLGCDNGKMSTGITLGQGIDDDEIFALKSSDVAHGMTCQTETDTYFAIQKMGAAAGGVCLGAYGEGTTTFGMRTQYTTSNTTDSCSSPAAMYLDIYKKTGTTRTSPCNNDNIFGVAGGGALRFVIKGDGIIHMACTTLRSLDEYCDVGLLRTIERETRSEGIIESKWDEYVTTNIYSLIEAGLYSTPPWEGGLLNLTQLQKLHNGAIWQLHTKLSDQSEELAALKGQFKALQGGCS